MKAKGFYFNLFTKSQKELLSKLKFLKEKGFYLAGGTGLALQIGHRTSLDFDFYTLKKFNNEEILIQIKKNLKTIKPIHVKEDTLIFTFLKKISISLFTYPYPLLKPLIDLEDILIASIDDISAMKLVAIIQRGTKRDFIDIYYLIKKLGLKNIIELAKKKYEDFNVEN